MPSYKVDAELLDDSTENRIQLRNSIKNSNTDLFVMEYQIGKPTPNLVRDQYFIDGDYTLEQGHTLATSVINAKANIATITVADNLE